ncbi:DUF6361 family protein [Desulfomicrobium baculatum]|uniref:Uncharacterized protein n=1 Tax=Desulfomicrobium baculatum (strain DSM 4028 / VKM B-1378 / X) TaxID=525897 RepID=C7LS27_DESBD|nr:DUF6361 family protein [Desulfomicrobium baculatum]ACU89410.1 conserved hypothetical protein [Desulfomicrobium baculatum DSM 4028]
MTASLTWLDHDSAAYERSLRLLALFKEKESRDELGIGAIRDAIADRLFPGTSTIQTRLRYMCFIPWIYAGLEKHRVPANEMLSKGREAEARLMVELGKTEKTGVIGREAGATLKRLPSSIYWSGMGAWGLRRFQSSQQEYHRSVEKLYALRKSRTRRDDGEWLDEQSHDTWYAHLLRLKPSNFPTGMDFNLTKQEASLLVECLQRHQRDSLLAWLARSAETLTDRVACDFPWQHPKYETFPLAHRNCLYQGRIFSFLHKGAALLYNLQLAELYAELVTTGGSAPSSSEINPEKYREALKDWTNDSEFHQLAVWSPTSLWPEVVAQGHSINGQTRTFVEQWWQIVLHNGASVSDSKDARNLIRMREKRKGPQSRFVNRNALKQWGGSAGTARLVYRWPTAQTFINDLQKAFHS